MELITTKIYKENYPFQLKQISQLPESMDIAGTLPGPEYKYLCVIGSRKYDEYGAEVCDHLISGLKNQPIVIVSGLAIGIDSLAHEAALKYGLKTVAFPGSGLSSKVLYPAAHRNLAMRILRSDGALISPFDKQQEGNNWTFPVRNRLMAGISHAVLIIEARQGSGTLLTAGYATEFNRDILAVHGSILSDSSYGPHLLIKDGATPIRSSEDILEALRFDIDTDRNKQQSLNLQSIRLSSEEKLIIAELQFSPLSSEELIQRTSINSSTFNTLISQLELQGIIRESDGVYRVAKN